MQLRRFDSLQEFCDRAEEYLLQYEAEHNLLLGILHTLRHYPERYPEPPYVAIVEADSGILAVAIHTPSYKLVLSKAMDLDTPVCWASGSQSLPTAARIGSVYTPLEYRRKGYATACVAALS